MAIESIKNLYHKSYELIFSPSLAWPKLLDESLTGKQIINHFFIPILIIACCLQLSVLLFTKTFLQALLFSVIYFISGWFGLKVTFLIIREYLTEKVEFPITIANRLTFYSGAIYLFFNSISVALVGGFWEQFFLFCSLIFIKSLYVGIKICDEIPQKTKTGLWFINFITIIVLPYTFRKLLCIIFSVSVYNI